MGFFVKACAGALREVPSVNAEIDGADIIYKNYYHLSIAVGTDKGLAYYDGTNWAVYRPSLGTGKPEMTVRDVQGKVTNIPVTTAPAHNYVLAIDFQGNDIWVATAKGLSHGILQP